MRLVPPLLALLALPLTATAQTAADSAGVRAAVMDYVEGIYRVDTARIVRSVRPEMAKRGYYIPRNQTAYATSPMTYAQLINVAKTFNAKGQLNAETAVKQVTILDILDQTASAKLVADWGIDYMHLAKYDGQWMIVNVLWQSTPAKR
jgi:hypothetical protein